MRKCLLLFVILVFMGYEGLFAQRPSFGDRLWGSIELSVAPSVVDVNGSYDEIDDDSYTTTTIGLNAFGGIYIWSGFSVGIGAGISYFDGPRVFYVPLSGELKYFCTLKRREDVGCFIYGRGGYPFLLGRNRGDGILAGAGFGFMFGGSQKLKYNVSAGYAFTHLDYTTKSHRSHSLSRHAIELRFGLLWL